MKVEHALRRRLARRASHGFTLIELMVVVVLVSVLAALAAPGMTEARNDRIAFDFARQYQQIIAQARARAAGTGAAHLVLLSSGAGGAGFVRLLAATDGTAAPAGPAPLSSCKGANQWANATTDPTGAVNTLAMPIDFVDLNQKGVNANMGLAATLAFGPAGGAALGTVPFIALCITPAGITYAGGDATAVAAIAAMQISTPFTGIAQATLQRRKGGITGTPIGIVREVIVAGGAAARLRSR